MSLRLKTIVGVGLIEAILLIILITTVLNYMRHTNEEALESYVATTSILFATTTKDAVLSFDLASLETFVEEILKNQGVLYARVMDIDHNILASGQRDNYQEIAFKEDSSYNSVDDNIYYIQQPVSVDGVEYGYLQMGFSTIQVAESFEEARRLAAIIAIIEMSLVALLSFCLGIYLTKQLKVLRNSARSIAAGDLDHAIDIKTHDEIGEVARSFNNMIVSLNSANQKNTEYQEELLDLNKNLAARVKNRTQKVIEQKDKLQNAYQELQETQEKLVQSEKMASIGQLAAGVAHEIHNPIAFVKGNMSSLSGYIKSYQELIKKQSEVLQENNIISDEINTFGLDKDLEFIH